MALAQQLSFILIQYTHMQLSSWNGVMESNFQIYCSAGAVALACVATVGECLDNRVSTSASGEKTPDTNACQCFSKGSAPRSSETASP